MPPCSLLTLSVCVRPFARARVRPCAAAKAAPSARRRPSDSSWPLPRPVRPSACGVKVSVIRSKKKTFMQNSAVTEKFRTSSSTVLKDKLSSGLIRYKINYGETSISVAISCSQNTCRAYIESDNYRKTTNVTYYIRNKYK